MPEVSKNKVGSIEGTVIDHSTQQPLPGVNIIIIGTQLDLGKELVVTAGYFDKDTFLVNADTTRTGFVLLADTTNFYPDLIFKAGSFLQTTLHPLARLSINAGLRYDYFEFIDESKISPRLGLTYYLTDKTTFNTAYGHVRLQRLYTF